MHCSTEAGYDGLPSSGCGISASGEQIGGQPNGTTTYTPIVDDHDGSHNGDASSVAEIAPKHKHFGANSNSTTLYDRNLKLYPYKAT